MNPQLDVGRLGIRSCLCNPRPETLYPSIVRRHTSKLTARNEMSNKRQNSPPFRYCRGSTHSMTCAGGYSACRTTFTCSPQPRLVMSLGPAGTSGPAVFVFIFKKQVQQGMLRGRRRRWRTSCCADVCVSARSSRERINKTCVFTCVLNTAVGVGHQCPACAPVHRQPPFSSFQRRSLFYQHGFLCRCCLAGPFVCVAFWERTHACL